MDLADLVRRPRGRLPHRALLRGLGDDWRAAETALLADVAARPRGADGIARRFERLARAAGEDEAIGRAARLRGSSLAHRGRHRESAVAYRSAARRLSGAARDGARIGLALALSRLGRTADAVRLCREVRRSAAARGDEVLAAAARMNEAGALHEGGDPKAALPLYREARDAFAAAGRKAHAARCDEALANALVLLDRFDQAAPRYESAARTFAAVGLAREAAIDRYNRGALLVATDRLGEADAELVAAEEALRAAGDLPAAALARLDRGEALLRARLVPEARRLLATACRAMKSRVPPAESARGALLLARAELAAGDTGAARRLLARKLPIASPAIAAEREELLGRVAAAEGRATVARRALESAAATNGASRPVGRARCLAAAAWCASEAGDAAAARRLAQAAERGASKLPVPGLRFAAHAARFAVEDRAGRAVEASRALDASFAALESLRAGLAPDAFRAALLRGSDAWFARAVRHVLEVRGPDAALDLVETWRARALVDLVGAGGVVLPPDERIAALRGKLAVLERRLAGSAMPPFLRSDVAAPPRRLLREVARAERTLREASERIEAPPATPLRAALAARALPEGTLVLSLFADAEGGLAFVVDRERSEVVRSLGAERQIAVLAEELHFRLGKFGLGPEFAARNRRRLAAETDEILAAIAERTLAPAADRIRAARRLVVVPHGPWHRVPFAALPFEGARLVERLPVVLAPSLATRDRPRSPARGAPLVVSVPDSLAPHIATEARRVAAALPGARLLEGDDATAEALAAAENPSVLHIAAHGRFRADAPALSGVRLADGWLRACEFPRLSLGGSLVVLSGCDTGAARAEGGAEVAGLVRGVFAAGAAEALVSLWRVDDEATAAFMADFHAARGSGLAAEEALRDVQRSRIMQGLHPWLWAGFALWTDGPAQRLGRIIPSSEGTVSRPCAPKGSSPDGQETDACSSA